ncbi:hypothetical protein GGS26DRAFT_50366 [Hypomontagnella submonticulosa]|nr:hypothetical protein GGS26DRAFT_50366 [Hypomontagnella submonticulosa]
MAPPHSIRDNSSTSSTSSSSSSSTTPSPSSSPLFPQFSSLPPELRHQIWRAAVPTPGINFFNVHAIPNDHPGANRSTSPNWLYLDLRRLTIEDTDDDVAQYDPSAWLARNILRSVCREARDICAIPQEERADIVLTRPRRGLFVRAADGQLRRLTPANYIPNTPPGPRTGASAPAGRTSEPLEHRTVQVHAQDILCLSVENCSFNLPFEETLEAIDNVNTNINININWRTAGGWPPFGEDDGWTFDPQLMPPLPSKLPYQNLCISMTRADWPTLRHTHETLRGLISYSRAQDRDTSLTTLPALPLLLADAHRQELGDRDLAEVTPREEVFWDRFGDAHVALPWGWEDQPVEFRLVKLWPEKSDVMARYMRSAIFRSPKRPARSN